MSCNNCKKGVAAAKQIASGYTNLAMAVLSIDNKDIEELAKTRLAICISCPDVKHVGTKKVKGEPIMYCNLCKCYISAAIRAKSKKCVNNKW